MQVLAICMLGASTPQVTSLNDIIRFCRITSFILQRS